MDCSVIWWDIYIITFVKKWFYLVIYLAEVLRDDHTMHNMMI